MNSESEAKPADDQTKLPIARALLKSALFHIDPWGYGRSTYNEIEAFLKDDKS